MKYINKKLLLILLIMICLFSFVIFKKDKKVILDNVQVVDNTNNKFAIQYQVNGKYEDIDKFLGKEDGYILNTELSKCQNEEGKELDNNVIQYDNQNKILTVDTKTTSYCYLFFDEEENLESLCNGSDLSGCITNNSDKLESINNLNAEQAGMYRYQGSNDVVNNNYICFGTDDVNACKGNEYKYMYRIIGITEDGEIEVIKKTALTRDGVAWNSVYHTTWNTDTEKDEKIIDADVKWSQSELFKRLNGKSDKSGNLFIGNENFDYLNESSGWYNKISDTEWLSGKFYWNADYFKIPTIYEIETGQKEASHYEEANPYYYNGGTESVSQDGTYTTRSHQDGITCTKYDGQSGRVDYVTCYKAVTEKFNDKVKAKIGLMHVYDYDYAVQKDGLNCFYDNVYDRKDTGDTPKQELTTCKNSWIHISNNDTTVTGNGVHDWTLSHYGFNQLYDFFSAWRVHSTGPVGDAWVNGSLFARPVFYLNNTIKITNGNGSINNPYVID